MKKRVVAGMLAAVLVLQIPFVALAAEADFVPVNMLDGVEVAEVAEAAEQVTECTNDWRNLPSKGKWKEALS